jgi:hypothetical protein
MTALSNRFRQVEFRVGGTAMEGAHLPETWLEVEQSGSHVRLKESAFVTQEKTIGQIRRVFPGASELAFEPLSLRAIFLANARTNRSLRAKSDRGAT